MRRVWLDWGSPCLPQAAGWLIDRAMDGSPAEARPDGLAGLPICDLRPFICVLPGRRAGRLLLAQLIQQCQARDLRLIPPEVLTPGPLVDRLLGLSGGSATSAEMAFAWIKALRETDGALLQPVLPHRPNEDDVTEWHDLAAMIAGLHEELAGQLISFAAVAEQVSILAGGPEADRWLALEKVHRRYLRIIAQHGLSDPHQARQAALNSPLPLGEGLGVRVCPDQLADPATNFDQYAPSPQPSPKGRGSLPHHVILIGVTDLNALQRAAIKRMGDRVAALVHAPAELADHFDELGCVIAERWSDHMIDLAESQIVVVQRPDDQAQEALRAIGAWGGRYAAAQITIGLGDEALGPAVARNAAWAGLEVHHAAGTALRQSGPFRLLEAAADWLGEQRFATLAALMRHPDIEQWTQAHAVGGVDNWLTLLDEYFSDHLHERLAGAWLGEPGRQRWLKKIHDAVNRLFAPLRPPRGPSSPRAIGQWSQPVLDVLANVYGLADGDGRLPDAAKNLDACIALRDILAEWTACPDALQPRVDAATALRLLLAQAAGTPIADALRTGQIEMLGWLELHLDPAPSLIIAGFNDGQIPQAVNADAFLPDSLRSKLGLMSNARRYARDAYLIEAIRRSREKLVVIAGRQSAAGDPLTPSRLLLACEKERLPARIQRMCGARPGRHRHRRLPIGLTTPVDGARSGFVVPALPQPLPPPPTYMNVTEFKLYLECPYRYALARLLKLECISDNALEMGPPAFGGLAHEALCAMAQDQEIAGCEDSEKIERMLLHNLDGIVEERYGGDPMPAVRVQIARLQQRLRDFARFQGAQNAEGWRIEHCELAFDGEIALDIPGQEPMPIHAKIDRIDRNMRTGQWRIIDYKTSESGRSPHKTHCGCERLPDDGELTWLDLQLPLYHYLATQSGRGIARGITGEIELAYIVLPKQSGGVAVSAAQWTAAHLECAIQTARQVVMDIRAGKFQRNLQYEGASRDFDRICQALAFSEEEGGEIEGEET